MSGRLVILPKKSWHVWSAANMARVERDEAAAAARVVDERHEDMKTAIRSMKGSAAEEGLFDSRGHLNLFSREERAVVPREGHTLGRVSQERSRCEAVTASLAERGRERPKELPVTASLAERGRETPKELPPTKKRRRSPEKKKKKESWADLRRRRLERETTEARRAAQLLRK